MMTGDILHVVHKIDHFARPFDFIFFGGGFSGPFSLSKENSQQLNNHQINKEQ